MSLTERQREILFGNTGTDTGGAQPAPSGGMTDRQREILGISAPQPEEGGRLGKIWDQAEGRAIAGSLQASRYLEAGAERGLLGRATEAAGDLFDSAVLTNSEGEPNLLGRVANRVRQGAETQDGVPRGLVGGPDVTNEERADAIIQRAPSEPEVRARENTDRYNAEGFAPKGIGEIRGLASGLQVVGENIVASGPYMAANTAAGPLNLLMNPALYGGEIVDEIDDKVGLENVDDRAVAGLAAGGGSLMGVLDRLGIASMLQGLGRKELAELAATKGLSKLLVSRGVPQVVANVAETAVVEAGTEALQEGVIVGAASTVGAEYTGEEVATRLATAGATGGLVGAGMRGSTEVLGAAVGNRENPTATGTEFDELVSEEDAALAAQAKQEQIEEDQKAQVEAQRVERSVRESRDKYVGTFLPEKEFVSGRQKQREADVLDPNTEIGAQFREWRLENDVYPANEAEAKAEAKNFLKTAVPKDDRVAARREWLAALDDHAANMLALEREVLQDGQGELALDAPQGDPAPAEGAQPALPLEGDAQPTAPTTAQRVASMAAARGVEIAPETLAQIETDIEQIKQLQPEVRVDAVNALVGQLVQGKKPTARASEAREQVDAAPAAEPAPKKRTKKDEAREFAAQELGEDWEVDFPDLSQMVEDGKSIYGQNSKFRRRVAENKAEAAAENEVQQATGTDLALQTRKPEGLSKNQNAVWDVLQNAFANNEVDSVLQADGSWNATNIAKLAGLKSKQSADMAIKQVRPKIAKAFGVSEEAIKTRLRDAAVENRTVEEAPAPDAPVSVMDVSELGEGGGFSTAASANQGARTGMDAEDAAFMEARSSEPNPVADQRAQEAASVRDKIVMEAIKSYGMVAVQRWKDVSATGDVSFAKLSDQDKVDWILATEEHMNNYIDDAQLEADQREIATKYDADNAGITQESIDEQDRAEAGQGQQIGTAQSPEPSDPGGEGVREDRGAGATVEPDRAQGDGTGTGQENDTPEVVGEQDWMRTAFDELQQGLLREGDAPNQVTPVDDFETFVRAESLPDEAEAAVMAEAGDVRRVPISSLRTLQPFIVPRPESNAETLDTGKPKAVDIGGTLVLLDGNHRVNRAIERGETEIEVRVTSAGTQRATKAAPKVEVKVEVKRKKKLTKPKAEPAAKKTTVWRAQRTTGQGDGVGEAAFGVGSYWSADEGTARSYEGIVAPVEITGPKGTVEINRRDAINDRNRLVSKLKEAGLAASDRKAIVEYVAGDQTTALPEGTTVEIGGAETVTAQLDTTEFVEQTGKARYGEFDLNSIEDIKTLLGQGIKGTYYTENGVTNYVQFPAAFRDAKPRMSVAEVEAEAAGTTADSIRDAAHWFMGEDRRDQTIVVRAPEDLIGLVMANQVPITAVQLGDVLAANPFGFVLPDKNGKPYAYFFTDNVQPGRERSSVVHEIGGHIGMDSLSDGALNTAFSQILTWSSLNDESMESQIAQRAVARVEYAKKKGGILGDTQQQIDETLRSEHVAYFLEEAVLAGVNPTVSSDLPVHRFVHRLWQTFKKAIAKFTGNSNQPLTVTDFLDVARGAAKLKFAQFDPKADRKPMMGLTEAQVSEAAAEQQTWAERNLGQSTAEFMANPKTIWRKAVDSTKPMHQFIRDNKDAMPSLTKWYDLMLESKETARGFLLPVESIVRQSRALDAERLAMVNDVIASSTYYQKWGYDPNWTTEDGTAVKVTVDPIMKRKFDRLNDEEKEIVRQVFNHGRDARAQMREIAEAAGVSKFFKMDSNIDGPYAPLKRFGNYVGELQSQELLDAIAAKDDKRVEKLKSDGKHYVVSFFESMGEAQKFVNANKGAYAKAEASDKIQDPATYQPGGAKVYQQIVGAVNANLAGLDPQDKAAMVEMVRDMYFKSLDESNARLSNKRRLNRAGFDKDMIRSLATHARGQAHLISQMKHGAEIAESLVQARNEARKDAPNLAPVYNTISKKFRSVMTQRDGWWDTFESNVLKFNTFYMLTSSVGYHVQNMTQPMMSVIKISGDFGAGQYASSWAALFRGYRTAQKVINTSLLNQLTNVASIGAFGKNSEVELDLSQADPRHEKLLKTLQLRDLLDVGMEEDLRFENKSNNRAVDAYETITHRLYQAARYVEALNRISSSIAAFDMASKPRNNQMLKKMKMTPEEYAIAIVEDTQGNFSQLDSPELLDALPKMTTQFRKYQFMMAWLHANAFKQAFKGESKEMRAAGLRTGTMLVGHTAAVAGIAGVPMVNAAVWALSAMFGEDEPEELERWLQDNIEDKNMATLIARGVPAFFGLDMSIKMSQDSIFLPYNPKFVSPEPTADGVKLYAAELALGPTGAVLGNIGNAMDFYQRGDYQRMREYMMPRGLRSYFEAARYDTRGYQKRNDVVVADPRDMDMWDILSVGIGLPSTEINQIKWTQGQRFELEQWADKTSGRIKREFIDAYNSKDRERQDELKQEFRELQRAKDRIRPFFGDSRTELRKQPVSALRDAVRRAKNEQKKQDRMGATN